MDYKLLAQKYIKYGIEWLESEFDTYKGMTTIMETEENWIVNTFSDKFF